MKTMAIRLDDELHAQLQVLAQLSSTSIADLIKTAIEIYVASRRGDPALADLAGAVLAEIDQAAATKRDAIANMFGGEKLKAVPDAPEPAPKGRGPKPTR